LGADYAKAIGVFFLVKDEETRTVLLPVCPIDVDEHLYSIYEENNPLIFLEASL
jgi:hypothetical protein